MEEKLLDIDYRKKIIREIKSDENIQRKIVSYKKQNMQNDNFYQYVVEYLESKYDPETVSEMDVFSNVNLQRRISKAESSIYKKEPTRKFFVGDSENEDFGEVYACSDVNTILRKSNEAYKYEDQCSIQMYLEDKKIKGRVLLPHHYDVVPFENNPEMAMCYIISNFDNTSRDRIRKDYNRTGFSQGDKYRDGVNQEIGDYDDSQLELERYTWWSGSYNFVTNGKGEVLDKETQNPVNDESQFLANVESPLKEFGIVPFVDISKDKDFEYWVRSGDALFDATIMYNVTMTSEFQTVKMQGHAQPYYKGDAEHMPENIRVGVDKMIFIPVDKNSPVDAEFGFANPGSDLAGIREFRESFLSAFLSSRGLDVSVVSGKGGVQKASSGIEKMLQMIEKFEASQEDFSLYRRVEDEIVKIISGYIAAYKNVRINGEPSLDDKYMIQNVDPKNISVDVEFHKPELIETKMEKLDIAEKEIEMGVSSRVHYLMEEKGMTETQAVEFLKAVDKYEAIEGINGKDTQAEIQQIGSFPEV